MDRCRKVLSHRDRVIVAWQFTARDTSRKKIRPRRERYERLLAAILAKDFPLGHASASANLEPAVEAIIPYLPGRVFAGAIPGSKLAGY